MVPRDGPDAAPLALAGRQDAIRRLLLGENRQLDDADEPEAAQPDHHEGVGDAKKGIVGFEQHLGGRPVAKWLPREIVYQPLWGPDNDIDPGVAPALVATIAGGLNENSLRFAANFFEHGAIPPVILTSQGNVPDQEITRIRDMWQRLYGSVRNAWRTA